MIWQVFAPPDGKCAVPADTIEMARSILARNAWNKVDPGWPWVGTLDRPCPPWAPWDRLSAWAAGDRSVDR